MTFNPTWGVFTGAESIAVGGLYLSTVATDPATLLGYGTWAAYASGKAIIGQDAGDADFDTLEETGGAKTVACAGSVADHASHTHSVTSNVSVDAHAAHTHSVTSNVSVDNHTSHTHDYTQVPNHVHVQNAPTSASGGAVLYALDTNASGSTSAGISTANPTGGVATGTTVGPNAALAHTVNNPAVTSGDPSASLTHTANNPAVTSAGPSATLTHTFTPSATSVVQPYIVVKVWKRTA